MKKTIGIIGGDERSLELARLLMKKEYVVKTYGVFQDDYSNIDEFLSGVSCLVSGIPFSRDSQTINAPNCKKNISIQNLFNSMKECKTLMAGSFKDDIKIMASKYDIKLYDFMDDEDFAIYNAIPTAEAALEIAMRETKKTINGASTLILGYGRIGKVLADVLKALHSNVTVAARKSEDFAWIQAMGYKYIEYSKLKMILPNVDILFNTVPALVIGKEDIACMRNDSLIIDLASKPGGVDFDAAKEKGIKAELALGLPGKVAPCSVAEYMMNKVIIA